MHRLGLIAGTLGLAMFVAACGGGGTTNSASSGDGSSSLTGKTIALVGYGNSNPWGAYFNKVFTEQLSSTGVKINDMTTMDPGTQVQKFNQAVAQKGELFAAFGGQRPTVVVGRHSRAVGAGVANGHEVADGQRWQRAVPSDDVAALTDGADDVPGLGPGRLGLGVLGRGRPAGGEDGRPDPVVRLVQSRPDQDVHRGVLDEAPLVSRLLGI